MKKNSSEKGALIVEASFVFPVTFFVILFLIYMGNMFYMRSRVDTLVAETAIRAAAYCADPCLKLVDDNGGSVPTSITDIQPYHAILGSGAEAMALRGELENRLRGMGNGFFSGMNLRSFNITQFTYDRGFLLSSFTVEVDYSIRFPIRFLGSDRPALLRMTSRSTAPVTDTGEFIQNVDMAMDYADSTGLTEKLNDLVEKTKSFLHR